MTKEFIPIDETVGITLPEITATTPNGVVTKEHYMVLYEMDRDGRSISEMKTMLRGLSKQQIKRVLKGKIFKKIKEVGWKSWLESSTGALRKDPAQQICAIMTLEK